MRKSTRHDSDSLSHSPTEAAEQELVVVWIRARKPPLRFAAVPNGGRRSPREAAALARQGVRKGVPDLLIFDPTRDGEVGLAIEMKRRSGGTVSPHQRDWHEALRERGWRVEVCRGADAAIAVLRSAYDAAE